MCVSLLLYSERGDHHCSHGSVDFAFRGEDTVTIWTTIMYAFHHVVYSRNQLCTCPHSLLFPHSLSLFRTSQIHARTVLPGSRAAPPPFIKICQSEMVQ